MGSLNFEDLSVAIHDLDAVSRRSSAVRETFKPPLSVRLDREDFWDDRVSDATSSLEERLFLSDLEDTAPDIHDPDTHTSVIWAQDFQVSPSLEVTLEDIKRFSGGAATSEDSMKSGIGKREESKTGRRHSATRSDSQSRFPGTDWVGIPPLHHQTDLMAPDRDFRPSAISIHQRPREYSACRPSHNHHSLLKQHWQREEALEFRKTQESKSGMPHHLLPFVPYIEKAEVDRLPKTMMYESKHLHIETIQTWLRCCENLHRYSCDLASQSLPIAVSRAQPKYLIDVFEGCIVDTPPTPTYVALSYVWGGDHESASATKANLESLRSPQGLYRTTMSLPRTIIDAIHLVHRLGKRYLWVDRLCIVQDETSTKPDQLRAMGGIYAGAMLTLVAAQHDGASFGLYGKRKMHFSSSPSVEKSHKKHAHQPRRTNDQIMLSQAMALMRTKWFSRGWTFQEYLFSRRRVVFHNNTMNWECLCASWHEYQSITAGLLEVSIVPEIRPRTKQSATSSLTGFKMSFWPDMLRYTRLMTLFNTRALTYPEDVLDAFAGCLHQLSQVFYGGFLTGMPMMFLDAALLWQPWTCMKRRESLRRNDAFLPTWSWVGWAGIINSESWRSTASYQFDEQEQQGFSQQCSWMTVSTVAWSWSEFATSERRKIEVFEQHSSHSTANEHCQLPAGWSLDVDLFAGSHRRYYHSRDPLQPFRRAIPLTDPDFPDHIVLHARFLHCNTFRAALKLGEIFESPICDCPAVELTTISGQWAGVLRLNCVPNGADAYLQDHHISEGGCCELIEISAGFVENQDVDAKSFDEWYRIGCPRHDGRYEFVNVLWIEWVDNIAYRKALGRVKKDVWVQEAKDRIAITLG
ncbi:hypothetical protein ACN47E_007887 [Coniothyrium glycines]